MKVDLIDALGRDHDRVHGCYQPDGGPCFYIASDPAAADYGRRRGRTFLAYRHTGNDDLDLAVVLRFLVGAMARLAKGHQIGDFDTFCRDVGLAKLQASLSRDSETDREEEVVLTRESPDAEFARPPMAEAVRRYAALKDEMLMVLAAHHARGAKRVPKDVLLDNLCSDIGLINRALNEFVERKLLRDLNHAAGMRLTADGQARSEELLNQLEPVDPNGAEPVGEYDFFVCYASEDRDLAELIDQTLTAMGYAVWRDRGQLTLGDSLTEKINEGLRESRYAIVILSRAFLGKNWPRAELNALQARTISEGRKVILPIRRDLDHEELANYLPLLGDRLTFAFRDNMEELASEIARAVKD